MTNQILFGVESFVELEVVVGADQMHPVVMTIYSNINRSHPKTSYVGM